MTPVAERLVEKWQPRLGLSQWRIRVSVVDGEELRERYAEVSYNRTGLWAEIRVLSPKEHLARLAPVDLDDPATRYEETVLHELLHLLFSDHSHPDGTTQSEREHDTIHILARNLAANT